MKRSVMLSLILMAVSNLSLAALAAAGHTNWGMAAAIGFENGASGFGGVAVIAALRTLDEPASVRVVTDSQYVANGMRSWIHNWRKKGWKTASGSPVKNRDLWEELDKLAAKHRLRWEWIRGHDGHPENERADALARAAIHEAG